MSCNVRVLLVSLLVSACLLLSGCGNPAPVPVDRLAVLPTENLSGDTSLDWISRAIPEIVTEELTGSPVLNPRHLESLNDAFLFRATRVLHSYFREQAGHIRIHAVIEDLGARRIRKEFSVSGALADGVLPLADAVARLAGIPARRFGTENPAAIRAYGEALAATTVEKRDSALDKALEADPAFSEAILAKVRALIARGERQPAREMIRRAIEDRKIDDEISRARLRFLGASLDASSGSVFEALLQLGKLTPADSELAERIARTYFSRRSYAKAAEWYRRAALADAALPGLWNSLGYAQAFNRDLDGARKSMERYRDAEPDSPNPLDSLGEIHFLLGRFARAEKYFRQTYEKSPSFQGGICLIKAARCRLMMGDRKGADRWFEQYAERRRNAGDPWIGYRAARWNFSVGRRARAIKQLEDMAGAEGTRREVAAAAREQLAVWALLRGDRESSLRHVALAQRLLGKRATTSVVVLCRFLVQPPAGVPEWKRRAEETFPDPAQAGLKRQALMFAFLLSRRHAEARAILEQMYQGSPPLSARELPVLFAGTLIETGDFGRARDLLALNPLVEPGSESPFYVLVFPRILYLRAMVAKHFSDRNKAVANYRLFLDYSGNIPLAFGDEKRARRALEQ